jgi:hypothetical protein
MRQGSTLLPVQTKYDSAPLRLILILPESSIAKLAGGDGCLQYKGRHTLMKYSRTSIMIFRID